MLTQKTIKQINSLNQKKFRQQAGLFIVEGVKGVGEAMNSSARVELVVIEDSKRQQKDFIELARLADQKKINLEYCAPSAIKKIKSTETFPGILAVIKQPEVYVEDLFETNNIICLDKISDPGNLGTIIRTADWFGLKNIILSENCVELYNPKVVRATMGSIFHVNIFQSNNLADDLLVFKKEKNYFLSGLVLDGVNLEKMSNGNKTIYILGSESHGIRPEIERILDKKYTILGKG